mmetsp:Transcript_29931/g.86784  ORF Transcript_29931/g.86784 Transcript_29931/m.86784 type:complete len:289 (+) Transcript_29931:311-1177(+)
MSSTALLWPVSSRSHWLVRPSHNLMVASVEQLTSSGRPSGHHLRRTMPLMSLSCSRCCSSCSCWLEVSSAPLMWVWAMVHRHSYRLKSQTCILPSSPPVARSVGCASQHPKARPSTLPLWPPSVARTLPLSRCTTLHVMSADPVAISGKLWCVAMATTASVWKASVLVPLPSDRSSARRRKWRASPPFGLHTAAEPSSEPVQMSLPAMPNAPHETAPPCWPAKICITLPVGAHQSHAVQSRLPARSAWPFGCQATHSTSSEGPSRECSRDQAGSSPSLCMAHTLTIPS